MLEVPRIRSYNICMMNERDTLRDDWKKAYDRLMACEHGDTVYVWLRRRAEAHYYNTYGEELEGSSDVSCYLYDLWVQYCNSGRNPRRVLNDGFGFWINAEVKYLIEA